MSNIAACLGAISVGFAMHGAAIAAPVDDYVTLKVAELIDNNCFALKYVEHQYALNAMYHALAETPQSDFVKSGRFSNAEYDAWVAERDSEAAQVAAQIGCTQNGQNYLLTARARASELVYRGLVLAFYFDQLPDDNFDRQALEPDEKEAAQRYDAFLQQVYQANFQAFAEAQRGAAMNELPQETFNPFGAYSELGVDALMRTPQDQEKLWSARLLARSAVQAVEFEVAAETSGFRVLPFTIDGKWTVPSLLHVATQPVAERSPVVYGPSEYVSDGAGGFRTVVVQRSDGGLRLLTYGAGAGKLGPGAIARIYVPTSSVPEGTGDWAFFDSPAFRTDNLVFEGTVPAGLCLSGPCFDFAPDVTSAIMALGDGRSVEIFVAASADAQPREPGSTSQRYGRFGNILLYNL